MKETLLRSSMAEQTVVTREVIGSSPIEAANEVNYRVRYAELLGMPLGTASARLKKLVLFDLVKRLGLENCYRCEQPIESADELDLDHKEPWRDVSADLFWNLDNVGFSHHACNIAAARKPLKKMGSPGTSWCAKCKEFKQIDCFGKGTRNGLNMYCKQCDAEKTKRYAERNPRFNCPQCRYQMRKKCGKCGYEISMKEYMALRRKEGVKY